MKAMDRREIDKLWTLPAEDFTRARDELAKRAKEEGDAEGAKEIKSLRKPTVAAWAVNQVAREHSGDVKRLLGLGEVMRRAQRDALGGSGREALRTATADRRQLVDQLVKAAQQILEAAGHGSSRAVLDKVSDTLTAVATDEATADQVGAGTLQREVVPASGLEDLAGLLPAGPQGPTRRATKAKPSAAESDRIKRADERAKRLEEAAAEAEAEAASARSEADRLARETEKANRAAEREEKLAAQARERADRARTGADELEEEG
jgi:hypothetical protein